MTSAAPAASAVASPSVKDLLIDLTFVDPSGARRKAKGLIGECYSCEVSTRFFENNRTTCKRRIVLTHSHIHTHTHAHHVVRCAGKTLYEVCQIQGIDLGPASIAAPPEIKRSDTWYEPTFGEGVSSGYDHVVLVGQGSDTAERMTPVEQQMLEDHWDWDEIFAGSRLSCAVTLTKEMDGMTVYIPDRIVDDIP